MQEPKGTISDTDTVIREIFQEQVYGHPKHFDRDKAVIDIGANLGAFSIFALGHAVAEVHAYEPNVDNHKCLVANTAAFKGRIHCHREAVTDKSKKATLYLSKHTGGHLCFPESGEGKLEQKRAVASTTLGNAIARCERPVGFVKMDCEGSEGLIFRDPTPNFWEVPCYSIEYHDNVSPMKSGELVKLFQENGYTTNLLPREGPFGYILAVKP